MMDFKSNLENQIFQYFLQKIIAFFLSPCVFARWNTTATILIRYSQCIYVHVCNSVKSQHHQYQSFRCYCCHRHHHHDNRNTITKSSIPINKSMNKNLYEKKRSCKLFAVTTYLCCQWCVIMEMRL